METWFQRPRDQQMLVPQPLVKQSAADRLISMISGPATSTPMGSSKDELLRELLALVQEISDGDFRTKTDDLNISLQSLPTSSQTETSSDDEEEEWEVTPPTPPLKGGKHKCKKSLLRYVPFMRKTKSL
nr:ORF3 [Torque teno felis virus]